MIRLERLQIEGFKRLSGIELSFPPRCCVLVEGGNEAGKSTLFESIYFALYGDALVKRGSGRGLISSAIRHGLSEAFVALTMSVGDTQLEIQRTIFRRRSNTAQLVITDPGHDPETVSSIRSVNERIIRELNGLDGEALLNSCFVEQKRLDKLEGSTRAKREEVLLKLLDMDRLTELGNAFKWGRGDDRDLDIARDKLRLVQAAHELTEAQKRQAQVERQLKLVAIHIDLGKIDQQHEIVKKQSVEQEEQEAKARRLDKQLARLSDLRSAETALKSIQSSLATIVNYEAEVKRLQDELEELDRLECEELPNKRADLETMDTLQNHLEEIKGLEEIRQRIEDERERLKSILSLANVLEEPKNKLEALPDEEKAAHDATENAEHRLKAAQRIEAVQRWKVAYRAAKTLADADEQIESAQEQAESIRERQETLERERRESKAIPIAVVLLLIGLVAVGISFLFKLFWPFVVAGIDFLFNPLWLVAAVSIAIGIVVGVRSLRQHRHIRAKLATCDNQLHEYERIAEEQKRRKETVTEQKPPALETCVTRLDELEVDVPESEEEADTAIAVLEDEVGEYDIDTLIQAVGDARSELSGLDERRKSLEVQVKSLQDKLDDALAKEDLPDIDAVKDRIGTLQRDAEAKATAIGEKRETIAGELERFDLAQETESALNSVATRIGRLANEAEQLEKRILGRDRLKQQQSEWKDRITDEQNKIRKQRGELAGLSDTVGFPIIAPVDEDVPRVLDDVRQALGQVDESQLKRDRHDAQQAAANACAAVQQARDVIDAAEADIEQNLTWLELPVPDELTSKAIILLEPEFSELSAVDRHELETQRDELVGETRSRTDEIAQLEGKLNVRHQSLDEESCQCELEDLEQRKSICHRARPIIDAVRERILLQVLPSTIDHMQLILPLLTAGRYHHADLDSASYKIRVWDAHAGEQGEYVEKDFFSGGTQDQFSLALRLGFALAALPQELGVSPGFIFLDEPLSAFDRQRTTALVKLLTEGEVAKRFDQIFLIAHDRTFETCPFSYYIRLEEGQIVEHNLNG
jgi:exonuclease SbcC